MTVPDPERIVPEPDPTPAEESDPAPDDADPEGVVDEGAPTDPEHPTG